MAVVEVNPGVEHEQIAILDFGSQYTHLIARRIRELNVFSELFSCLVSLDELRERPLKGIILSGGPASVNTEDAPHLQDGILEFAEERGIPVLGICYGFQEMVRALADAVVHQILRSAFCSRAVGRSFLCLFSAQVYRLGGRVEGAPQREFGHADLHAHSSDLFAGLPECMDVWMSHSDKIIELPPGFQVCGTTRDTQFAAAVHPDKKLFGIQFHPEVSHTPQGRDMLGNFVKRVCGCKQDWTMKHFLESAVQEIRDRVGPDGRVIGAVSGGVDSTVAAVLMHQAIGERFHAILVDNGLLRKNEAERVLRRLRDECHVNLDVVDARDYFMDRLEGVEEPEQKRKIIGNAFIEVFEREAHTLGHVDFLLQGTLYPDVIESVSYKGPSATIKTHHNVGGLLEVMKLDLIEPLRELFKDEVRSLGLELGVPRDSVFRHPFPGPGLAVRILGPVTREDCAMLCEADNIYIQELRRAGEYDKIAQAFAVLLPIRSVGVMGDCRTYERVIALRAVVTTDFMTAKWYEMPYDLLGRISTRIINEVPGINRVVYDVSSKPPATIEWE